MRSVAALSLLALAGLSAAQQQYEIDPDTVSPATREYWCKQQKSQCPLICLQQPGVKTSNTVSNDCDPDTLTASCVCDNNVAPNITQYTQTMPYFKCTEWGTQCVKACGTTDSSCASACRADHPCGAQDPAKPNATASASPSQSAGASQTQSGSSQPTNTGLLGADDNNNNGNGSKGNGAVTFGTSFGTLALSLVGAAAFAYL